MKYINTYANYKVLDLELWKAFNVLASQAYLFGTTFPLGDLWVLDHN